MGERDIIHFALSGLLPGEEQVALNLAHGTLSLLAVQGDKAVQRGEVQFTRSEIHLIYPLLEHFPYHCPYEVMQAWFARLHPPETDIVRWRNRLREAESMGIWDKEMRPVRNTLSRARLKLLSLGIEINAILETGYMLEKRRERAGKRRKDVGRGARRP